MMYAIPFVVPPLILLALLTVARLERWVDSATTPPPARRPMVSPIRQFPAEAETVTADSSAVPQPTWAATGSD